MNVLQLQVSESDRASQGPAGVHVDGRLYVKYVELQLHGLTRSCWCHRRASIGGHPGPVDAACVRISVGHLSAPLTRQASVLVLQSTVHGPTSTVQHP